MNKPAKILIGIIAVSVAALGMFGTCVGTVYYQERQEVDRVVPLESMSAVELFGSFASVPTGERPTWIDKAVMVQGRIVRVEDPVFPGPGYVYLEAGDGSAVVCAIPATVFFTSPLLVTGETVALSGICDAYFPAESIVAMKDCAVVEAP